MLKQLIKKIVDFKSIKTNRKLVVIMSDDWGSIRVESSEKRELLIAEGFSMQSNRFNANDTLESNTDLELLFEVLLKHKDSKGNHPVFTALTNVANPDFDKIKAHHFEQYFYESFTATLQRYPNHDRVAALYLEGICKKIFIPEFHGREHLNVASWMQALKENNQKVHKAFRRNFFFIEPQDLAPELTQGFGAAYQVQSEEEIKEHKQIITSGLDLFEQIFNYKSVLFTAPSQLYSTKLEPLLKEKGVRLIDVSRYQKRSVKGNSFLSRFNYTGKSNKSNQIYLVRNAVFEPNMNATSDGVAECLYAIEQAFLSGKPAIISNHRAAFVGGIAKENREKGLKALDQLLQQILQKWPEVEFVSARDLEILIKK